ncbi:hypothetical protein ACN47E_006664 [Coniothyrium glycines]
MSRHHSHTLSLPTHHLPRGDASHKSAAPGASVRDPACTPLASRVGPGAQRPQAAACGMPLLCLQHHHISLPGASKKAAWPVTLLT